MSSPSDKELIKALAEGDEAALTALVNRYLASVYKFAFRFTNDKSIAEDISQEVFLRVYQKAADYNERFAFKTWLFTIVRNASLDAVRSRKSWRRLFSPIESTDSDGTTRIDSIDTARGPEEKLSQMQQSEQLGRALESLPDKQRIAIILQYYEGLTVKEIAEVMRTSVSAIESLLIRAKRNLAKLLTEQFL